MPYPSDYTSPATVMPRRRMPGEKVRSYAGVRLHVRATSSTLSLSFPRPQRPRQVLSRSTPRHGVEECL